MAESSIVISDTHLRATLAKRIVALQRPGGLFAALALDLHGSVEDVLEAQGKPKWKALSRRTTIPARKARGTWPGKMLQETGRLAASIQPDNGEDFAQVSTNLPKARTLHFGALQGQFGRAPTKNGKGRSLPWGNIPARPFMVITKDAKGAIIARTTKWLRGDGL